MPYTDGKRFLITAGCGTGYRDPRTAMSREMGEIRTTGSGSRASDGHTISAERGRFRSAGRPAGDGGAGHWRNSRKVRDFPRRGSGPAPQATATARGAALRATGTKPAMGWAPWVPLSSASGWPASWAPERSIAQGRRPALPDGSRNRNRPPRGRSPRHRQPVRRNLGSIRVPQPAMPPRAPSSAAVAQTAWKTSQPRFTARKPPNAAPSSEFWVQQTFGAVPGAGRLDQGLPAHGSRDREPRFRERG